VSVEQRWAIVSEMYEHTEVDIKFEVDDLGRLFMEFPGDVESWRDDLLVYDTPGMVTEAMMDDRDSMVWWGLTTFDDDNPLRLEEVVLRMAADYLGFDTIEFEYVPGKIWIGFMGNVRDYRLLENWETPHYYTKTVSNIKGEVILSFD
jgi:hypothetical protein